MSLQWWIRLGTGLIISIVEPVSNRMMMVMVMIMMLVLTMVAVMTMVLVMTMVTDNCLMQSCDKQLRDKQMCDKPLRGVCRISLSCSRVLSPYNSTSCSAVQIKDIAQCTTSGWGQVVKIGVGIHECARMHIHPPPTWQPIRLLLLAVNQYEKQCADFTLCRTMR